MAIQSSYAYSAAIAIEGALADGAAHEVLSMVSEEATAEIPFGVAVVFNQLEAGDVDNGAVVPDAIDEIVAGIVVHQNVYSVGSGGELGDTGLKPGATLNVLRKGRIWVKAEDAVVPGDRLFVRAVAGGGEQEGALRMSQDDSTDCIDCTNCGVFLTSADAGALSLLEVDFTNTPGAAA